MIPPTLTARLLMLGVTTLAGTVVPFVLQDRPRLLWVWDKIGPRVVTKVQDRVDDRFVPPAVVVPERVNRPSPQRFDNEIVVEGACINPNGNTICHPPRHPLLNPNDYCRHHWWTAGPVRAIASWPFRVLFGRRCR